MLSNSAFLAAGTGIDYITAYHSLDRETKAEVHELFERAMVITNQNITPTENTFNDNLADQIRNYCLNCAISNAFFRLGITPRYIAGYSMGLYSALYTGRSIDFTAGVSLISKAFHLLDIHTEHLKGNQGAMGVIIGLSAVEVNELLQSNPDAQVEIANVNNQYSVVISGLEIGVGQILRQAAETGALHTNRIKVSFPYHTKYLTEVTQDFASFLSGFPIKDLEYPLISTVDQSIITAAPQIKKELALNLSSNISWQNTILKMAELGITYFIEQSPGNSLEKIGKYLKVNCQFLNHQKVMAMVEKAGYSNA